MTEQTMTPDEVLAVLDAHSITAGIGEKSRCPMAKARTAVAAMIARNAELEAALQKVAEFDPYEPAGPAAAMAASLLARAEAGHG